MVTRGFLAVAIAMLTAQPSSSTPPPPPATNRRPPPRTQPPATVPRQGQEIPEYITGTVTAEEGDSSSELDGPPVDLSNTWTRSRTNNTPPPRYVEHSDSGVFYGPNPVGYYTGVSMGGNQEPPNPPAKLGKSPAVLTWTGFERVSGGSRVFFQLSAEPAYTMRRKGNRITLRMKNTRVKERNNLRLIDLRYFKTPIQTVKVTRRGRDAVATIVLKQTAEPRIELKPGTGDYSMLVVSFGAPAEVRQQAAASQESP